MTVGFDKKALIADLKTWWDEEVGEDNPLAPAPTAPGTIMDLLPILDSLATVQALVVIEKHLAFEVPPTVIRPGGYHSFDDMTQDMLPKLQALVEKHAAKHKGATASEKETI
jgi:hypothetical protein